MKIGIIGSNGFIGSNLFSYLNNLKFFEVYKFSSFKKNKKRWIEVISREIKLQKPNLIINCAADQNLKNDDKAIIGLIESNLKANAIFLNTASKSKNFIGYITFGSKWEYNEKGKFQPLNFYASTKHANDIFLKYYSIKKKITTVSLKVFDTYGVNDSRQRVLNLLLKKYKQRKILNITPGNQYLDYVHIIDLCRLVKKICNDIINKKINGFNTFSVSSKKPIKLKILIKKLNNCLEKQIKVKIGGKKYRKNEAMKSIKKLNNYPGWKPKLNLIRELKKIFDE